MGKSLLLNSALLEIRIPALVFNCPYASSIINKIRNLLRVCGIRLHLRIPLTFCGIHLQLRYSKQLAIFAWCGIRDATNVPTNLTLRSYVRGIHGSFLSGIHLRFGTCLKISFWKPGTYRHKIMRLSSAQFGLVKYFLKIQNLAPAPFRALAHLYTGFTTCYWRLIRKIALISNLLGGRSFRYCLTRSDSFSLRREVNLLKLKPLTLTTSSFNIVNFSLWYLSLRRCIDLWLATLACCALLG